MKKSLPLAVIFVVLSAGMAQAHVGHGSTLGFDHGFMHPIGGVDHVLAMIAVGVFASVLGGRALWLVPLSFVSMMVAGGMLGNSGFHLPIVETIIALSVIILGAAVALQWKAPVSMAMTLVGLIAVFHGFAHGAEMPTDVSSIAYGLGFVIATAALHGAGLGLGLSVRRYLKLFSANVWRIGGSAMAVAGVGLLGGLL